MLQKSSGSIGGRLYVRYCLLFVLAFGLVAIYKLHFSKSIQSSSNNNRRDENNRKKPKFFHPPATSHLECHRLFNNDMDYVEQCAQQRVKFEDQPNGYLPMDCASIKQRNYFTNLPMSAQEANFPIAHARIVYQDYGQLEMELAAGYAPQNWYCYALDAKSDPVFQMRIRALADCFPNVFVAKKQFVVKRKGVNMDASFVECIKELVEMPWKYVILLQNHDIQIRTNLEIVQVLQWLNGTNDIEVAKPPASRIPTGVGSELDFESLRLFRNESKYIKQLYNGLPPKLQLAKGYVESSLSRAMAEFIVRDLNLEPLLELMRGKNKEFGREMLFPSLHSTDALEAPGGFTHKCLDEGKRVKHITRFSVWYNPSHCGSHHMRHSICVFGVEDLGPNLAVLPHLFANKLMPGFDFGAIACWYEKLFNRSYVELRTVARLNEDYYKSLPHVRFNQLRAANPEIRVNLSEVDCDFPTRYENAN
uniref:Uncharacterized protein n=2 Tax=Ditylenchus dipsaci TaxID=166011 RepID=A0A915CX10_9BILA